MCGGRSSTTGAGLAAAFETFDFSVLALAAVVLVTVDLASLGAPPAAGAALLLVLAALAAAVLVTVALALAALGEAALAAAVFLVDVDFSLGVLGIVVSLPFLVSNCLNRLACRE
jgi:hypothetical protein